MDSMRWGIIGFGEVGSAFSQRISTISGTTPAVTDPMLSQEPLTAHVLRRLEAAKVEVAPDIASLVSNSDIVLSLVPPSAMVGVAETAASSWRQGLFVDFTSVSPTEKQRMSTLFVGESFVDGAILGSIVGGGTSTPLALAGPRAEEAHGRLSAAGFNSSVVGPHVGGASALKMCRSIFMKGLECLFVETLLAAAQFKIREAVLASIEESVTSYGLRPMYEMLVTTHATHCARRSDEMQGVVQMVREMGMPYMMSDAARVFLGASFRSGVREHFGGTVPGRPEDVIDYLTEWYKKEAFS